MEWTAEKLREVFRVYDEKTGVGDLIAVYPQVCQLPEKLVIMLDMAVEVKYLDRYPPERELFYDFNTVNKTTLVEEGGYETLREDLKDPDFWDMIIKWPPEIIYKRYQITPPK